MYGAVLQPTEPPSQGSGTLILTLFLLFNMWMGNALNSNFKVASCSCFLDLGRGRVRFGGLEIGTCLRNQTPGWTPWLPGSSWWRELGVSTPAAHRHWNRWMPSAKLCPNAAVIAAIAVHVSHFTDLILSLGSFCSDGSLQYTGH